MSLRDAVLRFNQRNIANGEFARHKGAYMVFFLAGYMMHMTCCGKANGADFSRNIEQSFEQDRISSSFVQSRTSSLVQSYTPSSITELYSQLDQSLSHSMSASETVCV
jgi:hypothetical protein